MSLKWRDYHDEKMRIDPQYRQEYEALEEEFALAKRMIEARAKANLTQAQIAERMGITQPSVARIESGKNVSLKTLGRYAKALGAEVKVEIVFRGAKG